MIKVLELFAGIGACSKALDRLGIEHEIVDAVEIDKYAVKSFNAIHGTNFEPQDITKWDKDIECDLIMHGSPCQDFSIAGKQAGGNEGSGTRSSLLYETLRIVEKTKPKYVLWENVRNLMSARHRPNWEKYCKRMEEMGYKNFAKILNAKDYGVPQNRERVYTLSILRTEEDPNPAYEFPEPETLTKKLKDVLEKEVDEKYYIKDATSLTAGTNYDTINGGVIGKMHDISRRAYHLDAIAPTMQTCGGGNREPKGLLQFKTPDTAYCIDANYWKGTTLEQYEKKHRRQLVPIKTATKTGYDLAQDGDGIDLAYPDSKTRRSRVGHGYAKTLSTSDNQGCLDGTRIRKLTPKECWRLMGFDDEDFEKAQRTNSNTQLYKQAGNSIVVDVLVAIIGNLIGTRKEKHGKEPS